ncbi:MAG: hypothetical protein H7288_21335 [Kineosporiaceae bacterium]|nr:hypothetical protein [Aeromicrobium sp.]
MKVFWSWQSDRPGKLCRNLVQGAIVDALKMLSDELALEESDRPEIDHDTKGTPGMPLISETILDKITAAGTFVADITTVGRSEVGEGEIARELPNPNVLIELGWAWARLTDEKIILVANKAFGPQRYEDLPFDIRGRRAVVFYEASATMSGAERKKVQDDLAKELRSAIELSLTGWLTARANDPGPAGVPSRDGDPSVWFPVGKVFEHQPFHGGAGQMSVGSDEAPRLYVRMVPEGFANGVPAALVVHQFQHRAGGTGPQPMYTAGSGDGGLNDEGVIRYGIKTTDGVKTAWSAAQWFEDTGELWSFDTARLSDGFFLLNSFIREATEVIERGIAMYDHFSRTGLLRIEAGGTDLKGTNWFADTSHGRSMARRNQVQVSEARRKWSDAEIIAFVTSAGAAFANVYGVPKPDENLVRRMLDR